MTDPRRRQAGCRRHWLLASIGIGYVSLPFFSTLKTHNDVAKYFVDMGEEASFTQDCAMLEIAPPKAEEVIVDIHMQLNESDLDCDHLIKHFHNLQEAYWSQDDKAKNPPLINYGFYGGQGYGRLIDHSVSHCVLALALNRPCAVDLNDRDPYYTWRSFFTPGTYNWEMTGNLENISVNVAQAIKLLPRQSDSEWPANGDPQQPFPHLHLMRRPQNWPTRGDSSSHNFWPQADIWRPEHVNKPILSPNWGPWFPHLIYPDTFGQCATVELASRLQNALYAPTPLAKKLHQERASKVQIPKSKPFGAIHVRYVILQQKNRHTHSTLLPLLQTCLQSVAQSHNVTDWWIISDRHSHAIQLASNVTNATFYYDTETANHTNVQMHSNNARGKFGQADMSVSVLDWMVLYESQVAIVTEGSFGDTGARGHNKFLRQSKACGFLKLFY